MLARAWGFKSLLRYQNKNSGLENLNDFSDPFVFVLHSFLSPISPRVYKLAITLWFASIRAAALPYDQRVSYTLVSSIIRVRSGCFLLRAQPVFARGSSRRPAPPPLQKNKPELSYSGLASFRIYGSSVAPSPMRLLVTPKGVGIFGKKSVGIWEVHSPSMGGGA